MILGIHASVAQGLASAVDEVRVLGLELAQMLPYQRNNIPGRDEISEFISHRKRAGVRRLVIHSRFVPNPGSNDEKRRRRSVELLAMELSLAQDLGGESFVMHAGAYSPGFDGARAAELVAETIDEARRRSGCGFPICVENVPGGGRRMGADLEGVARIIDALKRRNVDCGVCLDTAHAWAAGYPIDSEEGALGFLSLAENLFGSSAIRVFHLNDTLAARGSHRENHWHWGKGLLSRGAARAFLRRKEYAQTAAIIETPKGFNSDAANLEFLRSLAA
ncbi:MAG: TIM barrel protein [Elusimicrobiota bacterium]